MTVLEGTWPADDLRRAFVEGAKWWEYESTGATMWPSDRNIAEAEAERRFPGGKRKLGDILFDENDHATCPVCGSELEHVRPGKWQCNTCEAGR